MGASTGKGGWTGALSRGNRGFEEKKGCPGTLSESVGLEWTFWLVVQSWDARLGDSVF